MRVHRNRKLIFSRPLMVEWPTLCGKSPAVSKGRQPVTHLSLKWAWWYRLIWALMAQRGAGAPAVPLIRSSDWRIHRATPPNPLPGAGFATFAGGMGRFTPATSSALPVPRWRLPAIARRRWIVASHDKTFERRVAGAERRLSMIEWRHSAFERRLLAFGRRAAMIATRLWTIESRLPEVLSRDGMVLSRHSGVGRRGRGRACARTKKKGLPWGSP